MATEGRAFNWDDSIKEDAHEFTPLPEGDYNVTIEKFDRSRSSGSGKLPPCNMAVVCFIVHCPDGDRTIRENYVLHSSLEWKLSELFRGVGLKKEGEELRMDWGALPGKTARAKIGQREGTKDPTKKYNYIEKLYPKEDSKPAFTPGGF